MGLTGLVFVVSFFILLLFALIKHPRYGVVAYLFAFYVHPPSRWWGAALPDLRWSMVASAVTLIALLKYPRNPAQPAWLSTTPARVLILLTLWVWLQNLWALDAEEAMSMSILNSKYIVLFYLVYRTSDSTEGIGWLIMAHVAGCFYLGTVAYGTPVSGGRLDGVGGPGIDDSNILSMQLVTGVVCAAMIVLMARGLKLYFATVAAALILNAIVMCGSRGAFLALLGDCLLLLFLKPLQYRRRFYVLGALAVSLFAVVANASFWERMNSLQQAASGTEQLDTSAEGRIVLIKAQWLMAALHPLGTGHRGTVVLSREFLPERYLEMRSDGTRGDRASHNTFMSALVEHGIPGAVMFSVLVIWCWKAVRRTISSAPPITAIQRSYVAAIATSLFSIFVAGMFVDCMIVEVQYWMLAMLASIDSMRKQGESLPGIRRIDATIN